MANYVKFVKGTHAKYEAGASTYSTNGSIYFAAEEGAARGTIYANGVAYGVNSAELAALNAAIDEKIYGVSNISYTATNASITFTKRSKTGDVEDTIVVTLNAADNTSGAEKAGLMTAAQKTALEGVISDVEDLTDVVASNKIKQTSGKSDNKTILITPGQVIEEGGTKTITKTNIDVNLGNTLKQDATSGAIDANIDGTTIVKDANGVLSVASQALTQYVGDNDTIEISAVDAETNQKTISSPFTVVALTALEIAALSDGAQVKEAWKLVGKDGSTAKGAIIKEYKDSSLISISYANQTLTYTYVLADGTQQSVDVDMSELVQEAEVENGIQSINHKLSVKKDTTSEQVVVAYSQSGNTSADVFTISADGLKIANIQRAIDAAVGKAQTSINTTVTGESASHMTITETVADNGSKSYSFGLADVASEDALEAEATRAEDIEGKIATASGLVITKSAGNPTTVTYSPEAGANYGGTATNIKDRIAALDAQIKANADAIDTLDGDSIETIEVNGVSAQADAQNKASVTIDGSEIQIDKAKTSANHALINTGGNIYDDATLKAAITALEAQLLWYQAD